MNSINKAQEVIKDLLNECQRYREEDVPESYTGQGYFTFTLYYHLEEGWGQRVVTYRTGSQVRDIWIFPREPMRDASENHFETLKQANLDYMESLIS